MRLARNNGGLVVYSVGYNGVDDGGRVVPVQGEKKPRDRGFRLLDPEFRGLVVVDDPGE
jgi:hypothetical protein